MSVPGAISDKAHDDAADPAPLRIELIESFPALESLADEWQELLTASSANGIFLTWDWVHLWWQVYGRGFELFVLTARRHGRLVGIAPLMIRRLRRFGLPGPRILMMIGQGGGTLAERFAFIAAPDCESEVFDAFIHDLVGPLGKRWDMLRFERLQSDAPATDALIEALARGGVETDRTHDRLAPYVHLPASMDDFLASRSSNFRSQYRGSVRKLGRLGDVQVRLAGRDIGVPEAMEILGDLHRRRFDAEVSSSFRNSAYLRFHGELAVSLQKRGWLWLAILEADGKPIAARYDFVYAGKVWCMQGGWDPEYSEFRPGMVLTGAVFEWAMERGLSEYDFLCGDESYKARWSSGERILIGVRGYNRRTLVGRWLPAVMKLRRRARGGGPRRHGSAQSEHAPAG